VKHCLTPLTLLAALLLLAACAKDPRTIAVPGSASIEAQRLSEYVRVLASDEFGGRAPGTPGETRTIAYLIEQFEAIGIEPGGPDGSWTQTVPMIHTRLDAGSLTVHLGEDSYVLRQAEDIEVSTVRAVTAIEIDQAPVVFVGYGVSAPERDWDDFGAIDLRGKIALFLVNDPDFAAAADEPVAGRFGNRRMTYYGRWTYKFEEAARRGALGALVIHETEAAGYGWHVAASAPGERYALANAGGETVALQGWLHGDVAAHLVAAAGHDLAQLQVAARHPDFQAFELDDMRFSADFQVAVREIDSENVLGVLPGSTHPDEILMAAAHWDSYGQGAPDAEGRTVRPGANDDALGTAGVLELARVLKAGPPLQRSVVFALWTAEESGLLGSQAYADNPVYPLASTVANFTLDILQTAGLARDVILVGEGQSELEDDLARVAATQTRVVTPENLPENGLFYRADHFSLARAGVPVLLLMGIAGGNDLVEGGRTAGNQWVADYVGNCYHQTCDAWDPDWNLAGAVQDIELFQMLIEDLGNSRRWPEWKAGSEFKALRDSSRSARQ